MKKMLKWTKLRKTMMFLTWAMLAGGMTLLNKTAALASSTTGMPWEPALETVRSSLNGPVAYSVAVIAVIGTGIMMIFGQSEGMFHKIFQIAFVLSLIFGATTLISSLFSGASGLVF